jgi:prophage regulatory protein
MNQQAAGQTTKQQTKQLETALSKAGVVKSTENGVKQYSFSQDGIELLYKELAPTKLTPTRIIRVPEVCNRIGTSRTHLHRLINAGKFPSPVKLSEKLIGFYEHDVEAYLNSLSVKGSK